jgi:hypothetical protein
MVRVRGPLMSVGATGTFGKALYYQRKGGGHSVTLLPAPRERTSPALQHVRCHFRAAMQAWKSPEQMPNDWGELEWPDFWRRWVRERLQEPCEGKGGGPGVLRYDGTTPYDGSWMYGPVG